MLLTILAIIQGISEFLPVSSTAHMIIIAKYLGNIYPGIHYLVILHIGSMLAIMLYFWNDICLIIVSWVQLLKGKVTDHFHLSMCLIIGTLPVIIVNTIVFKIIDKPPNTPFVIGINSIVFGFFLYICDLNKKSDKNMLQMSYWNAFLIGTIQAFALLPGASRSGTCISASRALGYSRTDSTRFAFLLGIPAILGASVMKLSNIQWNDPNIDIELFAYGGLISFVISYLAIFAIIKLLERMSFLIFAIYRVLLGIILLLINYNFF